MSEEIKTKLDSMTKTCRCVINFPFKRNLLDALDDLSANQYQYACIIHDKDVDRSGVLKTKHLHLVFECPKRHRLSFYINRLTEYFGVEPNQVSIQVSNSYAGDIQYLIHKNNNDKFQYPVSAIKSSYSLDRLNEYLTVELHQEITAYYVLETVKSCRTKSQVIMRLGLGVYNLYQRAINDFINDGMLGFDLRVHSEGELDRIFGKDFADKIKVGKEL